MRKLFDQLSGSFYNELMEAWSPNPGYPIRIRICADARITPTNILDDQVWDLSFLAGEQSTLSLETSFGLRARLMRLYFLYKDVGKTTLGPEKRFSNTQFLEILPNYIKTLSRPFTDIEVTSEYFAQASDAIAGRITLNNTGSTTKYIQTDAFCKLIPFGQGKQAGVQQQGLNKVFAGHCGDIYPCFFITGGPEHNFGQSSSLRLSADLAPKGSTTYNWSMVSSTSLEESFTRAKQLISLDWEGTSAYLDLLNKSELLAFHTGNPEWDRLLYLTQIKALSLLISIDKGQNPRFSYQKSRNPDQGYTTLIGGFQNSQLYDHSTLEAIHLANIILPGGKKAVRQITDSFFPDSQDAQSITLSDNSLEKRSILPLQTLLSTLTLMSHEAGHDDNWCMNKILYLKKVIETWFDETHDQDQDGLPEPQSIYLFGHDEISLFSNHQNNSQNTPINFIEAPQIGAFLYKDIDALQIYLLAHGSTVENERLEFFSDQLKAQIDTLYNPAQQTYNYRHAINHQSGGSEKIVSFSQAGDYQIRHHFSSPQPLILHFSFTSATKRSGAVTVHGKNNRHSVVETFPTSRCPETENYCIILSTNTFTAIDKIIVKDLANGDSGWIGTIDYTQTDLTSLLPVWAGIMDKDQAVGVLQNMVEKYRSTVGLVTQPSKYSSTGDNIGNSVSMFWNGLFIETLLDHGLYDQAVNITKSLLDGASQALAHTGCLGGLYHPETGSIIGTADTLDGLFPTSIFLKILGIQKLTLEEVIISGFNPFPAPIEVKYRTLSILCSKNETKVTQYNKPPVIINNSGIHRLIF